MFFWNGLYCVAIFRWLSGLCLMVFLLFRVFFFFFFFFFFWASETAGLIPPLRRDSFSQKGHLCNNYVASLAKPGNCFVIKYSQHSLLAAKSEWNLPVKLSFKMYLNPSKSSAWSWFTTDSKNFCMSIPPIVFKFNAR